MITEKDKAISAAAFSVWQDTHMAQFDILMAYKHCSEESLEGARHRLAGALKKIDSVLDAKRDMTPEVADLLWPKPAT